MKNMLAILSLMALIARVVSTQIGTCSCGQQGYEQHQPQQHLHHQHHQQHDHVQQQQYHHQQEVHVQPQQQSYEQSHEQHHQLYQGHVQQQPPQNQHHQQCHDEQPRQQQEQSHDEPPLHQQPSKQGYEKQPCQQIHDKKHMTRCGHSYHRDNQNLNNCYEFLRQRCNPHVIPFLQSRLLQPSSCQVLGHQCCQEVRRIEPRCLHQAISNMVQAIIQQQQEKQQPPYGFNGPHQASQNEEAMLTTAQYLPSVCGMHNSCCQSSSCGNKYTTDVRN